MVKVILFNLFDKFEYSLLLNFKDINDYNEYCKTLEFYNFNLKLKDSFGKLYTTAYNIHYGTDNQGIKYIKYVFNEQHDFKKSVVMWKRFFYDKNKIIMSKNTFKSIKINDIKLSLKIEFEKENSVKINLITVKQDSLNKDNFGICRDYEEDFSVWSHSSFLFDERQLRLPDEKNLKSSLCTIYKFDNEEQKKKTLKKLYNTLHYWSNKNSNYKDAGEVVLDDEYWYVL